MRVLALEPYHGGSHRAFLEGFARESRHDLTVLGLPPRSWKWRMRHAAVTFARAPEVRERHDVVLATSMLDLAPWRGLAPASAARLPVLLYFHENQLTYPARHDRERDLHFAYTHFTSCLAADAIAFNSAFHRDAFLEALEGFLGRMPDHRHRDELAGIRERATVIPPGCDPIEPGPARPPDRPLTILWAARWEHDKNPEDFFAALRILAARGVPFRLNVIGESFHERPAIFEEARAEFADRIDTWGFRETREEYLDVLRASDVVVSTATHEFFGISVVEAVLAGCVPLLPDRLAYPEVLDVEEHPGRRTFLHDGSVEDLANRLESSLDSPVSDIADLRADLARRFGWATVAPRLDAALERVASLRDDTPA